MELIGIDMFYILWVTTPFWIAQTKINLIELHRIELPENHTFTVWGKYKNSNVKNHIGVYSHYCALKSLRLCASVAIMLRKDTLPLQLIC
jgi:hypothetical protein